VKSANRELVDRLAAEYVLGTLRGRARRRFERWLVSPQVGTLVKAWEQRLAGLEPPLERVTPPDTVWRGIEQKLDLRKRGRAPVLRWLSVAAAAAFFAMVAVYVLRTPPAPPDVVQPPPMLASTQRGFLQADPQTIYWRVEVLGDNQEISLHVHKVHDLPPGKSHELWALPAGGGEPISLGLMPHTGDHHRVLSASQRAALGGANQIAVTLEPEGGSDSGKPTGPVLLVAPLAPV
jgi:anti-sigma-K factor RskA